MDRAGYHLGEHGEWEKKSNWDLGQPRLGMRDGAQCTLGARVAYLSHSHHRLSSDGARSGPSTVDDSRPVAARLVGQARHPACGAGRCVSYGEGRQTAHAKHKHKHKHTSTNTNTNTERRSGCSTGCRRFTASVPACVSGASRHARDPAAGGDHRGAAVTYGRGRSRYLLPAAATLAARYAPFPRHRAAPSGTM